MEYRLATKNEPCPQKSNGDKHSNRTAIEPLEARIAPAVTILISNGSTQTTPGSALTYTIDYGNEGAVDATGVAITETLPAGTAFNAAENPGWTLNAGTLTFNVGDLDAGETASTTLRLTVAAVAPAGLNSIVSTATIMQDGTPDPITASATDTDILLAAPDFNVNKTDGTTSVVPGASLTYTINYANAGNQDATGVVLSETLPAGTSFNAAGSSEGWAELVPGSGVYHLVLGSLAGGGTTGSRTFAVTVNGSAAAGQSSILNSVTIADDGANGEDPTPADNTATDTDTLNAAPDLVLTNSDGVTAASRNSLLTYTIGYSNAGNQGATGVVITDTLPAGMSFVAAENAGWVQNGNTLTFEVGAVAAGESGAATLKLHVDSTLPGGTTTIANTASIADDATNGADATPANNTATDTDNIVPGVDLTLTKTDGATTVAPGGTLTYTLSYTNAGDGNAVGVVITDTLPAGMTFSAAANPGWTQNGNTLTFAVGALAAGANGTATLVLTAAAAAPAGVDNIVNTASIADNGASGGDVVPGDNTATDTDTLDAAPDLTLTNSDSATAVRRGSTITYTLNYSNAGNQGATGVTITETLPAGTSFSAAANPGWTQNGNTLTFDAGSLAAGGTGSTTLVLTVDGVLPGGVTEISSTASIADDGANGADPTPGNNASSDVNTLIPSADLTLTKTDGVTTIAPGGSLTYTLNYANVGDADATGVVITETLPAGTSFDPLANPGWALNGNTLTFAVGTLAAGANASAALTLAVAATAPTGVENIVNTAVIAADAATGTDPTPADNTATDTDALAAAPDLTLTKTDGVATTTPGSTLTYTLNYANAGNQDAAGVVITETLPAGTSFSAAANPGWTLAGSTLTFNVGSLAAGATGSTTLALTVNASVPSGLTSIVNTAVIADDGNSGADATPADNTATDTDTVTAAVDLVVTTTDGLTTVAPGGAITYTLSYSNAGNRDAAGVVITQQVPAGTTFNAAGSAAGWTLVSPGVYELAVGALAGGANGTTTFAVSVVSPAAAGQADVVSTATIADDGAGGADATPANNTATDTDTLDAVPDLVITKTDGVTSASRNSTLTYTIGYSNAGNQDAEGVVITDTLPAATNFIAAENPGWVQNGNTLTFNVGALAGGANGTATLVLHVNDTLPGGTTTIANTASIADDGANGEDATPANNTVTDTDTVVPAVDLTLTKTDGVATVNPGDDLTYTLSYQNVGDANAVGVVITDTLPAGMTFSGAANPGWVQNGNTLTFAVGNLAAGASGTATLVLTAAAAAPAGLDNIVNTANIADNGASGADPTPANNTATDTDALNAAPDLTLTKSDGVTTVLRGGTLTYTLNYSNAGNQGASGVVITDTLPAGTSFSAAANPGWTQNGNTLTFDAGSLAAGATGSATLVLTVDGVLPGGVTEISNTATIADDGANGEDPTPANNTATDVNTITPSADLTLTKTDGVTTAGLGATLTYTLNYANVGDADATGVVITETLPAGTTFDPASNPGWTLNGNTLTFNVGTVAVEGTGTATLTLTVATIAPAGVENIVNTATIAADTATGPDPTPANNTATDSDALDAAPDLTLTKTDGVTSVTPGGTLTYTLNYANTGNQDAAGVVITETLPAGTSFSAAENPGWTLNGSTLTFNVGDLAAAATGSATLVLTVNSSVPAGQTTIVNTATIADDGNSGPDATPADNTATDTNTITAAVDLVVTTTDGLTTVAPGGAITYTLSYSNVGNRDAAGVVITQQVPVGTTFNAAGSAAGWTLVSPGVYELNVGALAGGASGTTTFAVSVVNPAAAAQVDIVSTASIEDDGTGGPDATPANNTATDTDALNAAPDLVVSKTSSVYAATRNGLLTYSLTYSNVGNQDATGVFVTENLPANMMFIPGGSSAGWVETSSGSGVYRFDVGALAGGQSATITFQVRVASTVPAALLQFTNTATIADDAANGADPTPANNTATLNTPLYKGIYVAGLGRADVPGFTVSNAVPQVKVYDIATNTLRLDFLAYESSAKRGVHVAVADFNGDGYDDVLTSYGGGGGRIRLFDGLTGAQMSIGGAMELNPFSAALNNGAFVAAGDVTGDGRPDIIVGEGSKGNRVVVYDGVTGQIVNMFTPFGNKNRGVRVAVGDTNGDGRADVIVSTRDGDSVKVFNGMSLPTGTPTTSLLQFTSNVSKNILVAAGDVTGDGRAEILISGGLLSTGRVETRSGTNGALLRSIPVYTAIPMYGVRVAAADVNLDGIAEIIAGPGLGGTGQVRFFNAQNGSELTQMRVTPFAAFSELAVRVAGTTTVPVALSPT